MVLGLRGATMAKDADGGKIYTFVASTEDEDRMSDRVLVSGWDLANYRRNPVVLLNHDRSSLPVGRGRAYVVGKQLMLDASFDEGDPRGQDVVRKLDAGVLNAVSVGFLARRVTPNKLGGVDVLEAELTEVSVVTVPANPNAVLQSVRPSALAPSKSIPSSQPQENPMSSTQIQQLAAEVVQAVAATKSLAEKKASPVFAPKPPAPAPRPIPGQRFKWTPRELGRFIQAIGSQKNASNTAFPEDVAKLLRDWREPEAFVKSVQEGNHDSAGVLVPVTTFGEVLELLRPNVLGALAPRSLPLWSALHVHAESASAQTAWVTEEGQSVAPMDGARYKRLILKDYKLLSYVVSSNEMLSHEEGARSVGDSVLRAVADALDDAALNGSGVQGQPLGLIGQAGNLFTSTGATIAAWTADLNKCLEAVLDASSRPADLVFLLSTDVHSTLMALRDSAGWAFRPELTAGRLLGVRTVVSPRVPTGKVVLADGTQMVWGSSPMSVDVLRSIPSLTERDESAIRAVIHADLKLLNPSNFAVLAA
jgi:HK97 family phage major capsid protein/HK97 family phage prohead protease